MINNDIGTLKNDFEEARKLYVFYKNEYNQINEARKTREQYYSRVFQIVKENHDRALYNLFLWNIKEGFEKYKNVPIRYKRFKNIIKIGEYVCGYYQYYDEYSAKLEEIR